MITVRTISKFLILGFILFSASFLNAAITWDAQETFGSFSDSADVARIYRYHGAAFSADLSGTNNFDYFTNDAAVGDILYIGIRRNKIGGSYWHNIVFNVGTQVSAVGLTVIYEYPSSSSAWSAIPNLYDGTNIFQTAGINTIYFEFPSLTYGVSVNGSGSSYIWFRIRITGLTSITEGGAQQTDYLKINNGKLIVTQNFGLANLVTADLAGTKEIMDARSATATMNPYATLQPGNWGTTKVSCIVSNYSVAGTISLTGRDGANNVVTETMTVTGNGTLISTNSYALLSVNGVNTTGTFTLRITQPRWGILWRWPGSGTSYPLFVTNRCLIYVGDGTGNYTWTNSWASIYKTDSSYYISNGSALVWGTAVDNPFYVYELFSTSAFAAAFYADTGSTTTWNNVGYDSVNANPLAFAGSGTLQDCKGGGLYFWQMLTSNYTINRVLSFGCYFTFAPYAFGLTVSDAVCSLSTRGFLVMYGSSNHDSANIFKIIRPNISGSSVADYTLYHSNGMGCIVQDPTNVPTSSKISCYSISGDTFKLFLDYSTSITVLNTAGDPIASATVVLKDKNGSTKFTQTTTADGTITPQVVTSQYWQHTYGAEAPSSAYRALADTDIVQNGPFTLTISSTGYQTKAIKFSYTGQVNWQVSLEGSLKSIQTVPDNMTIKNLDTTNAQNKNRWMRIN